MSESLKEKKRNNGFIIRRIMIYVTIMAFFIGVIIVYYRMIYNETRENIVNTGRNQAIRTAKIVDKNLSSYVDIVRLAGYTLDNMISEDRSDEEILDYLANETVAFRDSMKSDTTGIYGYIRGTYMDGSGWTPDEGYEPTERPWYIQTVAGKGRIITGDPYLDLDTGRYTVTIGKTLRDNKSVVAVDVFADKLHDDKLEHIKNESITAELILNVKGDIITHSDNSLIGTNIRDGNNILNRAISDNLKKSIESSFYLHDGGRDYMVYLLPLQYNWMSITVIDATDEFKWLKIPLAITVAVSVIIVAALSVFLISSDRRRREAQALLVRSERATAASEAKSEFLSNMSHEIRTPINAILGMNEMVLRTSEDKEVLEYSDNIKSAGRTLLGIINDILDFSKIEAGKMEIIPAEYELASVLNDLVMMVDIRAKGKGLALKLDFDEDTPKSLYGDEIRIKQIITNILTNAVKYTEKGTVTFSVGFERIKEEEDSILLKVAVKDTGIGIKEEDIHRLFSKFERIEEDRNRNVEGTGLGMNITMNLLDMMGSKLEVDSVYGEGSCFGFGIKQRVISWDKLGDYEKTYRERMAKQRKYKEKFTAPEADVLVVDDTPMNLIVFKGLIKKTGVKVDTGESGDVCIEKSSKKKYDMIFLDHMMMGMDGIETLRRIHEDEKNPNLDTPFICLTANAISGAREKYLEAGFDDYLTKPIEPDRLEEMMIAYLPKDKVTLSRSEDDDGEVS